MYEPLDASKLTREEKHDALESLLFITEKRMGELKAENGLWETSNAHSMDMTSPPEVLLL